MTTNATVDEPASCENAAYSGLVRGVSKARPAAAAIQRSFALLVITAPVAGVSVAVTQAFHHRITLLDWGLFGVMYVLTSFGVTIGYHRHYAHRAFKTSRIVQLILCALGAMAAQGPLLFWVAVHRRHHAHSDRPGDPHSPNLGGDGFFGALKGFLHAHLGWMLSDEVTSWPYYARDLMRDPFAFRIHQLYPLWMALGFLAPMAVACACTHSWAGCWNGFIWGGLVRIFVANQASWCVGSLCHMFGQRPFVTRDRSANNWAVALFTFGEGLQNNHHAFPSSAIYGLRWWEPDLSGYLVRGLRRAGVIWDVHVPGARAVRSGRAGEPLCHAIDTEGGASPTSKRRIQS